MFRPSQPGFIESSSLWNTRSQPLSPEDCLSLSLWTQQATPLSFDCSHRSHSFHRSHSCQNFYRSHSCHSCICIIDMLNFQNISRCRKDLSWLVKQHTDTPSIQRHSRDNNSVSCQHCLQGKLSFRDKINLYRHIPGKKLWTIISLKIEDNTTHH